MRNYNWVKWLVYAIVIFFVCLIQTNPEFPRILQNGPLLAIPAVITLSMFEGENAGAAYGIAAGLIWDVQTGQVFGYNAFFLLIAGIMVGLMIKYLFSRSLFTDIFLTLGISFGFELLSWFFFYYMTGRGEFLFFLVHVILPTVFYTALFTIPIYYGVRRINRKLTAA
ncbi:MAG TPA: rod shape-determining protein MreD [Clostridia bacterium]|nr:rod shape-determining protein MreD [Clostridia bacterium]